MRVLLLHRCRHHRPPPATSPAIGSLVPDTAAVGDTITVNGSNFGATQGTSTVTFTQNVPAPSIVSWSASMIRVRVPVGSVTGNITVTVGSSQSNGRLLAIPGSSPLSSFANDVSPLISFYNCANCHGSSGGFSVASHATIVTRVTVGNGEGSLLVRKLRGTAGTRMPVGGPYMTDTQIQRFVDWINQGAQNN